MSYSDFSHSPIVSLSSDGFSSTSSLHLPFASPHTQPAVASGGRGRGDWLWAATATSLGSGGGHGSSGFAARGHVRGGSTGGGLGRDGSATKEVGDGDVGSTARGHERGRSTGGGLGRGRAAEEVGDGDARSTGRGHRRAGSTGRGLGRVDPPPRRSGTVMPDLPLKATGGADPPTVALEWGRSVVEEVRNSGSGVVEVGNNV